MQIAQQSHMYVTVPYPKPFLKPCSVWSYAQYSTVSSVSACLEPCQIHTSALSRGLTSKGGQRYLGKLGTAASVNQSSEI